MKTLKKPTTSKFQRNGNHARHNNVQRQITISAPQTVYTPEIDSLEQRLLLSGITARNFSFIDADGDRVNVRVVGAGSFTITLDNGEKTGADISSIVLNPDSSGKFGNLIITTTPVRVSPAVSGVTPGFMSGGVTYVGEISVKAGLTQVGNVVLNAVAVDNMNFGTADVKSILLTTGKALLADRFNNLSPAGFTGGTTELQNIKINNITADDIGTITIRGFGANNTPANAMYNGLGVAVGGGLNGLNNFEGVITATSIGSINAPVSSLGGVLNVGSVGTLKIGAINADITTSGNLTLNVSGNNTKTISAGGDLKIFIGGNNTGIISTGGHLNIQIVGDAGGTISAGNGISGLLASNTDEIIFGSTSGNIIATGGNIASIKVLGNMTGGLVDAQAGAIGNINVAGEIGAAINSSQTIGNISAIKISNTITAVNNIGDIKIGVNGTTAAGDITSTNGSIGTVSSSGPILGDLKADKGSIGDITVTGNNNLGTVTAGSLGKITVGGDLTGAITTNTGAIGNIQAKGILAAITSEGNIGDITVGANGITGNITSNTGNIGNVTSAGGISGNIIATGGSIGNIDATSSTGNAISSSNITAKSGIGAITASATSGIGLSNVSINADSDGDGTGDIASITVTTQTGKGIVATGAQTIKGANIGDISITVSKDGGNGIYVYSAGTLNFTATKGNIGNVTVQILGTGATGAGITGTVNFTAENTTGSGATLVDKGTIGKITVTNNSTKIGADGINGTVTINAGGTAPASGTNVGNITVTTAKEDAVGISGLTINANNNTAPAASKTGSIGNISVQGTGNITGLTLAAYNSIGTISSNGTGDQSVTVNAKSVGNITFTNLDNTKTLTLNVSGTGAGTSIGLGSITIESPTTANKANIALAGTKVDKIDSIAGLSVDGKFIFSNDLDSLKTLGAVSVNQFDPTGALTIGGVSKSTVGYIQITTKTTTNGFDFIFTNYTMSDGTTKAGNDTSNSTVGSVEGTNLTTGVAVGQIGNAAGQPIGTITFKYIA